MTDIAATQGTRARAWRGDWRVILLMGGFCLCYIAVGLRMGLLAATDPEEPRLAREAERLEGLGTATP